MKKFAAATLVGLAAMGSLATVSMDADARPYHRHGGARVGVYFGAGILGASILAAPYAYSRPYYYGHHGYSGYPYPYGYSGYPYPYYGYAPAYYPPIVEQPSVYVEQQAPYAGAPSAPPPSSAPQAQARQQLWYFCQDTQTYYPHVQNCATPWQRVMPHAPQ